MKKLFVLILLSLVFSSSETKAQTAVSATATASMTTPVATVLDTMLVKPYVGNYKSDMGNIKVWIENGQLMGELEGQGSGELRITEKPDIFTIVGMGGEVMFIRSDLGKVEGLKIEAQGATIEGKRVE